MGVFADMGEKKDFYNRNTDVIKGLLIIAVIALHFPFKIISEKAVIFPYFLEFAVPGFMFISGYVRTLSYEKKGASSIGDAYDRDKILRSLIRLVVPFTLFFVFAQIFMRIIGLYTVGIVEYGLLALFFDYLRGFIGQGSYYFPLMLQFVFVFPLVWYRVRTKGFKGVIEVFFINLLYEVLKTAYGMSDFEYRFILLRYLFIIACGSFAALYEKKTCKINNILMTASVIIGGAFIYLFTYTSYGERAKIITYWQGTSLFACLYAAPLLFLFIVKGKMRFKPLEIIGRASFNIFLVQMLYYIYYHFAVKEPAGDFAEYLLSVLICVTAGVLFWLLEQPLTKLIAKKITRSK